MTRVKISGKLRTAIIKDCRKKDLDPDRPASEQKVCLYTHSKPHRLLGRHPDEEAAKKQERAIQWRKHGKTEAPPKRIRVSGFIYEIFQEPDGHILYKDLHKPTDSKPLYAKAVEYKGARYELVEGASPSGRLGKEEQAEIWLGYASMYLDRYLSSLEGDETDAQTAARRMLEKAMTNADKFVQELVKDLNSCRTKLNG